MWLRLRVRPCSKSSTPTLFAKRPLLERLEQLKAKRLVVAGMMSHLCVDATVRAAFDLGFDCTVVFDACATSDLRFGCTTISAVHVHGSFMAALGQVYATLVGVKDLPAVFAPAG